MSRYGLFRIATLAPVVHVGNPAANAHELRTGLAQYADADLVLCPELCLTGYTCEDLFHQQTLLQEAEEQLHSLAAATQGTGQLVVVGLPLRVGNGLYNCAAALADGRIVGIVPKQCLPNYGEFYEARRFAPATGIEPPTVEMFGESVPFGIDLLFSATGTQGPPLVVGIEICEDLWVPTPPSGFQALAGATVILNPSASNETVGKRGYRTGLVVGQSARCIAAYAYAGAGPTESTTDLVFGGHCLVAENGGLLAEADAFRLPKSDQTPTQPLRSAVAAVADVDVEKLLHDRRRMVSFNDPAAWLPRTYRHIPFPLRSARPAGLHRRISGTPFVPRDAATLEERCREIFSIQVCGLAKRLDGLPRELPLNIGVSGGLDSTLALLVAVKTCDLLQSPRTRIKGLTLPGFGTTGRTRTNATALMQQLGIASETIDVRPLALEAFRELGHRPFGLETANVELETFQKSLNKLAADNRVDLTFENVQARLRTFLLMSRGFVLGTGDLSEAALGWSTYNGDHMSMYNVNCSIPKTLVKFLVRFVALNDCKADVRDTLLSIADTPISPELLPASHTGEILQSTEETLGPYELHDFFLYNIIRNGYAPDKLLMLAAHADFSETHAPDEIVRTLRTFYTRFFANQYKRSCVPDGPKVGTVSLSPRGDWRMPSDAEATAWLAALPEE